MKSSIKEILTRIGQQKIGSKKKKELLWEKIYDIALHGDIKAAALIAEREEGKPQIDITTQGEKIGGFTVKYIYDPLRPPLQAKGETS